jgi:hypothetical protein
MINFTHSNTQYQIRPSQIEAVVRSSTHLITVYMTSGQKLEIQASNSAQAIQIMQNFGPVEGYSRAEQPRPTPTRGGVRRP